MLVVAVLWATVLAADLRSPWHGIVLVALAVSVIALAFFARPLVAAGFVTAAVVVGVVVWEGGWVPEPDPGPGDVCDPSCGVGTAGALAFLIPTALVLVLLGAAGREVARRRRR